ncbi:hypothetical protein E4T56_gene17294, partial [Termitomyces sp. T112]
MSGASGKVPAAIHVTPEALAGGPLALVPNGDIIRVCAQTGTLEVKADLSGRSPATAPVAAMGVGRELFAMFRAGADSAEKGGSAMLALADIGGTHARFTIATLGDDGSIALGEPATLKTSEHASFETAWEHFAEISGRTLPRALALAVAGPVG